MNKVKYKLNREWLNELLKHKTNSNVYFSLSDNDIRILLTYIDVLQSKIDKAIEYIEENIDLEMDDFTKIDIGCEILKILDLDKYNEFLKEND